jgi:pyruvate kinase
MKKKAGRGQGVIDMDRQFEIVATFSRMCEAPEIITRLIRSGVTCFRFSFSKDHPEYHFQKAGLVTKLAKELGKKIDLVMDLPGIKPRIMNESYAEIIEDRIYSFTARPVNEAFHVTHYTYFTGLKEGNIVITGDGELAFEVTEVGDECFKAKAILSGTLTRMRGLTLEGRSNEPRYLADNEKEFLALNFNHGQIFQKVWYSFVDSRRSILEVKEFCKNIDGHYLPRVIPKIETVDGVKNLPDIFGSCDEILIGRGDLALQSGVLDFYALQREAIVRCKENDKRVIVGTQLFTSSAKNWIPNRAELSDLSHLISLDIDGVLLEAEMVGIPNPSRGIETIVRLVEKYRN